MNAENHHPGSTTTGATDSETPRDWWKSAVVYQIYPRSFADSDGDGVGDLPGIIGHLDYLQRLGVDVVWLSPIYRSPMDDNGYDISDYQDVDPLFGTLEQLDELVAGVHERGMKVVMDLVVNHTSSAHAWFQESRSSRDNPKRDWYWWRPPRPGHVGGEPGAEPTNWGSVFSGSGLDLGPGDGGVLPAHLRALPAGPELGEPGGAAGRLHDDALVARPRHRRLPDGRDQPHLQERGPGQPGSARRGGVDRARAASPYGNQSPHVLNGPRIHEFLQEMHREVFEGRPPGLINIGEMPGTTVDHARLYTDPARRELDMIFQFEHVDLDSGPKGKWDLVPLTLPRIKESLGRWQTGLADVGWNSLYLGNHDQPRSVSRFGSDHPDHRERSAKALATVLHLHRGTPYVYQGDELGMTNTVFETVEDFRDIESLNHYRSAVEAGEEPDAVMAALRHKSRDNARTPMQWDGSPHAGFTDGDPWIPVNPNHTEINAAAQVDDPDSVFHHYRRLIALRHDEPAVVHGSFRMLLPDHEQLYAFVREHDDTRLLVVANLSSDDQVKPDLAAAGEDLDAWAGAELVLAVDAGSAATVDVPLGPWEARVHRMVGG